MLATASSMPERGNLPSAYSRWASTMIRTEFESRATGQAAPAISSRVAGAALIVGVRAVAAMSEERTMFFMLD